MVARPWSSSRLSCGERLLLRCDGNAGNSFLTTQGKDLSSRARRGTRASSGCGRNSHASFGGDKGICVFPSRLSLEAFSRGFTTRLSHVPPWCESILGLKVNAVEGKKVSLEWTETSGVSGSGGTTLEFLSPCLWKAPPLEMRWVRRKFFPEHAAKGCLLSI